MKKIDLRTESKRMLADVYTPVSIYLRLRDRFRDTILLESTDAHVASQLGVRPQLRLRTQPQVDLPDDLATCPAGGE